MGNRGQEMQSESSAVLVASSHQSKSFRPGSELLELYLIKTRTTIFDDDLQQSVSHSAADLQWRGGWRVAMDVAENVRQHPLDEGAIGYDHCGVAVQLDRSQWIEQLEVIEVGSNKCRYVNLFVPFGRGR
jgi:hypothetical protein